MFSAVRSAFDPALVAMVSALVIGCAGIPGLFLRKPGPGQIISAFVTILASCAGVPAALQLLFSRTTTTYYLDWNLPFGPCELVIDPLSAFFLLPVFLVAAAGSLFAVGYWPAAEHRTTERGLTFFYGLLASSMAILLTARNGVFFIMVWEVMALSAYFLLVAEHEREEVRLAGIVYLIATHAGTAALFVYFSLLAAGTGSFLLPAAGSLSALPPAATLVALAAFIGFGAKAGIMPLHIWLPSAHANAPSHVSALMSGVMLKMGLYGIFRTATFYQDPPLLWGAVLTVAGITSALLGIAFAVAQSDLKRLLACSSIENIGIITTGLGIALLGVTSRNQPLLYLGMAGVLLLAAAVLVTLLWRWRLGKAGVTTASTWGCGYQRGTSRAQYGGSSFSELAVSVFDGLVHQRVERQKLTGLFPGAARCSDVPTETLLERVIVPLSTLAGVSFSFLRRLQHGLMHVYMIYIFATLFILMLWAH